MNNASVNQHYKVLPIINVQVIDQEGNQMHLNTLLDTGSTSSFVSVSFSNNDLLVGETNEIHVDVNTLGDKFNAFQRNHFQVVPT